MRYIPHTAKDQKDLLATIGQPSLTALFTDIPAKAKPKKELDLPKPLSEPELLEELRALSSSSSCASSFLGGGSYKHFVPSVIKHIISRSEFYTAYTPYQAEVSQGILQAIYEYQTMICELTGMDAANASMYDGATAMAEAAFLACRTTRRQEILVSSAVQPDYRKVLKTYANGADLRVAELPYDKKTGLTPNPYPLTPNTACVILQQPNFFGCIEEVKNLADEIHSKGALFIASADPISLGLLKAPGDYGADIVVGEGQSLGNPQSFGGPGLGIFAVKKSLVRQIPGRVVGQTVDAEGKRGFCLTLQTREQHIRRERAASNICSNEALAALAATVYLSVVGKQGLRKVAELCLQKANYLKKKLGKRVVFSAPGFKELVIKTNKPVGLDLSQHYPELKGCRLICVTELVNKAALDTLAKTLLKS
ncbi:MAG: aminomethyl-transferring glycine dehydrogenase subunit GcvPA [Candidatus Margulisbacteria bacterium]|nr:aminomethyl-transferring glycine dehydrogenase subunit GcvPA [Candidatus Margulisiibacteriota bacterium]